jgi:hypothetical protein
MVKAHGIVGLRLWSLRIVVDLGQRDKKKRLSNERYEGRDPNRPGSQPPERLGPEKSHVFPPVNPLGPNGVDIFAIGKCI